MNSLVLFDIDATLLATGGLGVRAMKEAGQGMFGPGFSTDGLDFAGRLDPLLIRELFALNGVDGGRSREPEFRRTYARRLDVLLASAGQQPALPGVIGLLDALAAANSAALGLLTGNFAETGSMKLRASGIDPGRFVLAAWGDDSPHDPPARDHLPPVAMRRFREKFDRPVAAGRVVIIGDTPHDVRCAKVHGCRSIGVATGRYAMNDLRAAGADLAVPDLGDTPMLTAWLERACG